MHSNILHSMEDLENILLNVGLKANNNIILQSLHGVGKTESVIQFAKKHQLNILVLNASNLDVYADFIGIPERITISSELDNPEEKLSYIKHCLPKPFAFDEVDILFIDELNRAEPKILNALLNIIQDREISGCKLNKLKFIIGSQNPFNQEDNIMESLSEQKCIENGISLEPYMNQPLDLAFSDRFAVFVNLPYILNHDYLENRFGKKNAQPFIQFWEESSDIDKLLCSPRQLTRIIEMFMNPNLTFKEKILVFKTMINTTANHIKLINLIIQNEIINKEQNLNLHDIKTLISHKHKNAVHVQDIEQYFKWAIETNCKENNLKLLILNASNLDVYSHIRGIPEKINKENNISYIQFCLPEYFTKNDIDILFINELNRGDPKIHNALLNIIQFKMINETKLNIKIVIAAQNPPNLNNEMSSKNIKFDYISNGMNEESTYFNRPLDNAFRDRFAMLINLPLDINENYLNKLYPETSNIFIKWWRNLNKDFVTLCSPRQLTNVIVLFDNDEISLLDKMNLLPFYLKTNLPIENLKKELINNKHVDKKFKKKLIDCLKNNPEKVKDIIYLNNMPQLVDWFLKNEIDDYDLQELAEKVNNNVQSFVNRKCHYFSNNEKQNYLNNPKNNNLNNMQLNKLFIDSDKPIIDNNYDSIFNEKYPTVKPYLFNFLNDIFLEFKTISSYKDLINYDFEHHKLKKYFNLYIFLTHSLIHYQDLIKVNTSVDFVNIVTKSNNKNLFLLYLFFPLKDLINMFDYSSQKIPFTLLKDMDIKDLFLSNVKSIKENIIFHQNSDM